MAKRASRAADILLEVGTEEIPARFLPAVRRQLRDRAGAMLAEARLPVRTVESAATPRRLVAILRGVADRQADVDLEVLGPTKDKGFGPDGKPTPAAEGFARKHGVKVSELKEKDTEKGVRLAYVGREKGKPAAQVAPAILARLVEGLEFPKSMRWPQSPAAFARPVRWVLALLGNRPLDVTVAGVKAGRFTRGRRFVHPKPIPVRSVDDYLKAMKRCGIVIDAGERRRTIARRAEELAGKAGGSLNRSDALIGEVADLVEAPAPFIGTFPREALSLPSAVVIAAMVEHQRYFPVMAGPDKLAPHFVAVANGVNTKETVAGNERVLKARLADAAFFHREDRKRKLADFASGLKDVVWQAKGGSMEDKSRRLAALAGWIAGRTGGDAQTAARAGELAKADLLTQVVFEFPSLQGVAGGIYAAADGEPAEVAAAVSEHYRPRGPNDEVPASEAGAALALADKIDDLVGHFALGHAPSGTADPYGLRRAGIGIVRILFDRNWRISLAALAARAAEELAAQGVKPEGAAEKAAGFLRGRVEVILAEQGFAHDEIQAALVDFDDVVLAGKRMRAIAELKSGPGFRETVFALSRVTNILPEGFAGGAVDPAALDEEERALYEAHEKVRSAVAELAADGRFRRIYEQLATLKPAIDRFFDRVLVMDKDEAVRIRRLNLLNETGKSIRLFADVKRLVIS